MAPLVVHHPLLKRHRTLLVGQARTRMPEPVQRLDDRAFRALANHHSPFLDPTLPWLTRAANNGRLWYAVAAALVISRDPRARRAAARGLRALAVTSALVNGPFKLLVQRHRPLLAAVPLARRLSVLPPTTSFPSGHAASAAAFAVAASLEKPSLAAPLGSLAAAVGTSRVYVGAHYPSDVVAGAIVGAGIAVMSRRLGRDSAPVERATPPIESVIDVGAGERVAFLVNPASGSPLDGDPAARVAEAFPKATIVTLDGDPAEELPDELSALGVCGGDGTVNTAARLAMERDVPLLVVPGGTLNHFARDIGTADVGDAIQTAREGCVARVDVGSIDGRPFLNTASFGAYTDLVDERERLEGSLGKWPAAVVALARVLRRSTPVEVELNGRRARLWAIFIGNSRYQPRGFAPAGRASLDDGLLDVRVLRADDPRSRRSILLAALARDLGRSPFYEEWTTDRLEVRSLDGPLRLARDGETFDGPRDFVVEKRARALQVVVAREPGSSRQNRLSDR